MKDIFTGRHYARSFFSVLDKQMDSTGEVFAGLSEIVNNSPEMNKFLAHPLFSREEKKAALFKSIKGKIPPEVAECVGILIEKRKTLLIPDILAELRRLVKEKQGVGQVFVESSYELSEKEKKQLEGKLSAFTGKKTEVVYSVKKELIGGLIIKIGGAIMDNSLKTKINKLKEQLS